MSGYTKCPACLRTHFECLCKATCQMCGIATDHATEDHGEYLSEQASYYIPDEGGESS